MDRDFETGKHEEATRICANPDCAVVFLAQMGGQKSGSSPAIHIKKVGESPDGYCSTRCLFLANGWSLGPIREFYRSLGLDYDKEVETEGYLAPTRRLKGGGEQ